MNASLRLTPARRFGLLIAVALVVGACGEGALLSTGGDASDNGEAAEAPAPAGIAAPVSEDEADRQVFRAAVDSAGKSLLIVRTGQLNLEVLVLDEALAAADAAVTAAGGYIAASQRQGDDENASAMVTYRIPVERWEATLASLRKVGARVLLEQTGSEEVTSQVIDLGARLANLRATESALQAIMAKATRIPDILEVQAQLTSVRGEIEQLTAQKQSLEERAALATLTVGFNLPPVVAVTQVRESWDPASDVDRAIATVVGLGQGLASAAIWFAIVVLPLALVLGVLIGVAWLVARRVRPRSTPPAPETATEAPSA